MPPTIITVRHAEGDHNVDNKFYLRDATLTPLGLTQCAHLSSTFPFHNTVDLLVSSPLRRTIQTAVYSFGPLLARSNPEVKFLLHPAAQEVSERRCNVGFEREELKEVVKGLFEGVDVGFADGDVVGRIDFGGVVEGWNTKTGYWGPEKEAVEKRAADMRSWLFQRPEKLIVLVTHGAFLHYFTEAWDGYSPMIGSAYKNCDVRQFTFTEGSRAEDAHITETEWSRKNREDEVQKDETVVAEVRRVEGEGAGDGHVRSVI